MTNYTVLALGTEIIFLIIIGIKTFSDYDIDNNNNNRADNESQASNFQKLLVTMQGLIYYPNLFTFAVLEVAWKARIKEKGKNKVHTKSKR